MRVVERRVYEVHVGTSPIRVEVYYKGPQNYGLQVSGSIAATTRAEGHSIQPLGEEAISRTKEWFFQRLAVRELSKSPECLEIWKRIETWFREILNTEPQQAEERPRVRQGIQALFWSNRP